jgi:hypothetical protein
MKPAIQLKVVVQYDVLLVQGTSITLNSEMHSQYSSTCIQCSILKSECKRQVPVPSSHHRNSEVSKLNYSAFSTPCES